MIAALKALWAFITSKAGVILGAIAVAAALALKLISTGYDKRKTEEVIENAKARERMEKVTPPSSDDTADRLSDGTF